MDLDLPRPSQDGRVYWDSGPNDLLAQLRKTSLETTPASTRLKRTSISAGFPSPTRPGAHSPADTSLASSTSINSADSSSTASTSSSSTTGSRFSKRRRAAQNSRLGQCVDASTSAANSPDNGIDEAALRRINEITNLLSLRNKQPRNPPNDDVDSTKHTSHAARAEHGVLSEKTKHCNISSSNGAARKAGFLAKPPMTVNKSIEDRRAGAVPRVASSASSSSASTSSTSTASATPLLRAGSTFGRSQSAQANVLGARPASQAPRGIRSSPAKASRPTSMPIDPARARKSSDSDSGDISLQDDSFDLALGSMADEDFDAILLSASQQALSSSSGSRRQGSSRDGGKVTDKILPSDLLGSQIKPKTQSPRTARHEPSASSQQKLRAPFKAPSRVSPPAPLPQKSSTNGVVGHQNNSRSNYTSAAMSRVKSEPVSTAAKSTHPGESSSQQPMHPELQAALEAGFDFAADEGDLSF